MIDEQKEYMVNFAKKKEKTMDENCDQAKIEKLFRNLEHYLAQRTQIGEFQKNCKTDIHDFQHQMFQKLKRILKFQEENPYLQQLNQMLERFDKEFYTGNSLISCLKAPIGHNHTKKESQSVESYREVITNLSIQIDTELEKIGILID